MMKMGGRGFFNWHVVRMGSIFHLPVVVAEGGRTGRRSRGGGGGSDGGDGCFKDLVREIKRIVYTYDVVNVRLHVRYMRPHIPVGLRLHMRTACEVDGEEHSEIESAAELLYGLIHARYILTNKSLNAMVNSIV
ncbi:Casein kinase II subunit beta [Acorus calamus]|uniref:Casein kinase II subunit beta n=1 Tax=Acorus calamus TaxID=4465 RepID=A0AAV9ERQ0_ACOCL|nr:Casein kinase II subunit beta [Acorus calamus]